MELKYYLRGLGLGIAITAIVMGIVSSKNKTMTNEEIIARAKQLGMTENTVLTEINHKDDEQDIDKTDDSTDVNKTDDSTDVNKTDDSGKDDADKKDVSSKTDGESGQDDSVDLLTNADDRNSQTGERKTDSGVDAEAGDTKSETDSPETNTKIDSPETKPSGTDTAASDKPMVITIGSGDGSYTVSNKLVDVGAIESADDFDTFLCNNGYDKKIRTGTYTIPANASEEQMARIITGAE